MRDSLAALPQARQEARTWHQAKDSVQTVANQRGREADSLRRANNLNLDAKRAAENSEAFQVKLTTNERVQKEEYRSKAQRRGFVLWALAAVEAITLYLVITH